MIERINQNLELSENEIITQVEEKIVDQYGKMAKKISPMAAANHLIDISEKSRELELEYSELAKQEIKRIVPLINKRCDSSLEGLEWAKGILEASEVLEYQDKDIVVPLRINGLEKQVNLENRMGLGDELNDKLNRLADHIRHFRYFSLHTFIVSHLIEDIIVANYPPEINSTIDKEEMIKKSSQKNDQKTKSRRVREFADPFVKRLLDGEYSTNEEVINALKNIEPNYEPIGHKENHPLKSADGRPYEKRICIALSTIFKLKEDGETIDWTTIRDNYQDRGLKIQ